MKVKKKAPSGGPVEFHPTVLQSAGWQLQGSDGRYGKLYPLHGVQSLQEAVTLKIIRVPDEVLRLKTLRKESRLLSKDPRLVLLYSTLKNLSVARPSTDTPDLIPGKFVFLFFSVVLCLSPCVLDCILLVVLNLSCYLI